MNKPILLFLIYFSLTFYSCENKEAQTYIFFLHNRFLETHKVHDIHPQYGQVEYDKIIEVFEKENFKVISEQRNGETNTQAYAQMIRGQIDSLISSGVAPNKITVIGTSKGGYIAQYISTYLNNPAVNFVFIAAFRESDIENFPEINYCGNILTIFEKSDPFGVSAVRRKEISTCDIKYFKEVELNTGLNHGFIFRPMDEWIQPCVKWAKGDYWLD